MMSFSWIRFWDRQIMESHTQEFEEEQQELLKIIGSDHVVTQEVQVLEQKRQSYTVTLHTEKS